MPVPAFANEPHLTVGILSAPEIKGELCGPFTRRGVPGTMTGKFRARARAGRIVIDGAGIRNAGGEEVVLEPGSPAECSFVLFNVTIGVEFHWQRQEDQRFAGGLRLILANDRITAINLISIEHYLASVISSEMSAESSMHLLKAHAITSRSWLLAQLEKSRQLKAGGERYQTVFENEAERIRWYDREDHEQFDVCADDHCQRYQGITKVYTPSVRQAVEETRGLVLMSGEEICDARFSKSCGGVTETFGNVWEPIDHPYLSRVVDTPDAATGASIDFSSEAIAESWIRTSPPAFCHTNDRRILSQVLPKYDQETADFFRWKVEYTQEELADLVRRKSGVDFGYILDLIPVERGASARLVKLRIVGTRRTLIIGKELEIRRTLSASHLYSSAIIVEKHQLSGDVPEKFILHGAGWGHGVGLCQIGAAVMGEQGYPSERILSHYFPGAEIRTAY